VSVEDLYQQVILDHDRAPRNEGALADATHHATVDNPLCGDVITMHLRVGGDTVEAAAFEARGCALCRAAASILTTQIAGLSRDAIEQRLASFERFVAGEGDGADLGELVAFAGVRRFKSRRACALLAARAIRACR
jgi:nitrogen fixation NifU-like protein